VSPYTYTHTYTRAEALVDQIDALFREAGIKEDFRGPVCNGVNERWLEAIGLYLERDNKRVYEIEASINWLTHTEHPELSFSIDLPGWEEKGSPEAMIFGKRFAATAADEKLAPHYWVRFVKSIRDDPARHEELCNKVGVSFRAHPPDWKQTPDTQSLQLQDLQEIGLSVRSAL
jgi:hypothetical protein